MKPSPALILCLLSLFRSVSLYSQDISKQNNNFFRIQLEYLDLSYHLEDPLCPRFNQTYKSSYSEYNQKTFNELTNFIFYQICLAKQIRLEENKKCSFKNKLKVEENVINLYIHNFKKIINHKPNKDLESLPWFLSSWRDIKEIIKGNKDCDELTKLKPSSLGYYEVLNLMPIDTKNKLIGTLNKEFQINYKDKFLYQEKKEMINTIREHQELLPNLNKNFWISYIRKCFDLKFSQDCSLSFKNDIKIKANLIPISLIRDIESQVVLNLLKKYPGNQIQNFVYAESQKKLKVILNEEIIFIQSSYASLPSLIDRYENLDYLKIQKIKSIKIKGKEYSLKLMKAIDGCMPNYREFSKIISSKQELIDQLKMCLRKIDKEVLKIATQSLRTGAIKVKLIDTFRGNKNYYSFYLKKRFYQKLGFILPQKQKDLHYIEIPFSMAEIIRYILYTKNEFSGPLLKKHFIKYSDLLY
ncbi:hypothetical protein N9N67_06610 [Bacteriovoracaceae bacterium]|nr:hypothetical protein [Bacteriovoracaceae bacterium]